jgi:hypothetical protein
MGKSSKPFDIKFEKNDDGKIQAKLVYLDFSVPQRDPDHKQTMEGCEIVRYWFKELKAHSDSDDIVYLMICPVTKLLLEVRHEVFYTRIQVNYSNPYVQDAYRRWLDSIKFEKEFLR